MGFNRSDQAPAPYDIIIDSVGYVTARSGGAPSIRESMPVDQPDPKRGEDSLILGDKGGWFNGTGMRAITDDPATRQMLYYAEATGSGGVAGDDYGGGADGSYGPLIPGPRLRRSIPASSTGQGKVRSLIEFTPAGGSQLFLALLGNHIYRTADPLWLSGINTSLSYATGVTARRLRTFAGSAGMIRVYSLSDKYYIQTSLDGVTFSSIGPRKEDPDAFLVTTTTGATYTDDTNFVSGAGDADISNLNTVATNWILIGHHHPWASTDWTMSNTNGNVSAMAMEFWTGSGWSTPQTLAAGTLIDDTRDVVLHTKTLGQAGPATVTHTFPSTWVAAPLTETGTAGAGPTLSQSLYWARVSFSAQLDGSVNVDTIKLSVYQMGLCGAVLADQFAVVGPDSTTIYWTRNGGANPTWFSNFDPLPGGGVAIEMVSANDTWWVLGTNHLSAVGPDGSVRPYYPEIFQSGSVDLDTAFMIVWLGKIIFSLGAGRGTYLLDPSTGNLETIGPERQFLNDETLAPYVTCAIGDRTHALYGGWSTPGTRGFLTKWGAYKPSENQSGAPEYDRVDAWHMIGDMGTGRITTSMAAWVASGQPYVAFGTDTSEIFVFKTPVGSSPLASGSGYEYSSRLVNIVFPAYKGSDQARQIEAYAATVMSRNLSGSIYATYQTRDFTAGGSYDSQFSTTTNTNARQSLSPAYNGYGLESVLTMRTNSNSTPWIIDRLLIHQMTEALTSQLYIAVTVLVDDDIVTQTGGILDKRSNDWLSDIDTLMAKKKPVALVRAGGATEYVIPRARSGMEMRRDAFGSRKQAITLYFSTAEGAPN